MKVNKKIIKFVALNDGQAHVICMVSRAQPDTHHAGLIMMFAERTNLFTP